MNLRYSCVSTCTYWTLSYESKHIQGQDIVEKARICTPACVRKCDLESDLQNRIGVFPSFVSIVSCDCPLALQSRRCVYVSQTPICILSWHPDACPVRSTHFSADLLISLRRFLAIFIPKMPVKLGCEPGCCQIQSLQGHQETISIVLRKRFKLSYGAY